MERFVVRIFEAHVGGDLVNDTSLLAISSYSALCDVVRNGPVPAGSYRATVEHVTGEDAYTFSVVSQVERVAQVARG